MDKMERIEYLDYVKAICIFRVMMEHRRLRLSGTGAFLLPSFFIISGFTFSINNNKSFKEYALKRVKRLLIHYWIMMVVYENYAFGSNYQKNAAKSTLYSRCTGNL